MNKYFEEEGQVLLNFTHWATDRRFEKLDWKWEQKNKPFCLKPASAEDVGELTEKERRLTKGLQDIWLKLEADRKLKEKKNN